MNRRSCLMGVSMLALCASAPLSWAQTAGDDETAAPTEARTLSTITVTAQRTEENLQSVPISVTAVTDENLGAIGALDSNSLVSLVPGYVPMTQVGTTMIFLRGIGTTAIATENSIGTYVDGVYIATQHASLLQMNNVKRIEVLKGPQGTLFGRNATGGVISYITKDPGQEKVFNGKIGYASYETLSGSFYAATPISDKLAGDIALFGSNQGEGWGENLTTGQEIGFSESFAARSKLVWDPTEDTKVTLAVDYATLTSDVGMNQRPLEGAVTIDGTPFPGFYNSVTNVEESYENTAKGVSVKVEHDFGPARIVSISAYREADSIQYFDQDGGPVSFLDGAPLVNTDRTYTQELQLLSPASSNIQWILGGFYMDDLAAADAVHIEGISFPAGGLDIFNFQQTDSFAVFGQATGEIFANTNLTLGVRYTEDERTNDGETFLSVGNVMIASDLQSKTFDKVTYRAALDHQFSSDVMGYISYNRGFKSGAFNLVTYANPPVNPEVLDAYEIGIKSEFFNNTVRLNASAFYYDYSDIQLQSIVLGSVQLSNAAAAELYGLDVEFQAVPTDNLTIHGGFIIMDGEYTDYLFGAQDRSGFTPARMAEFSSTFNVDYLIPTGYGDINVSGNWAHNSGYFFESDMGVEQPEFDLLNGSFKWTAPDGGYSIRLFGKNLLDEEYIAMGNGGSFGDLVSPAAPQTFGIELSVGL